MSIKSWFGVKLSQRNQPSDAFCKKVSEYLKLDVCIVLDKQKHTVAGYGDKSKGKIFFPIHHEDGMNKPDRKKLPPIAYVLYSSEAKTIHSDAVLQSMADMLASACVLAIPVAVCQTNGTGWPIILSNDMWQKEIGTSQFFWSDVRLPGLVTQEPGKRFSSAVLKQDSFSVSLTDKRGKQFIRTLFMPCGFELSSSTGSKTPADYIIKILMIAKTPDPGASRSSRDFDPRDKSCPFHDCTLMETIGRGSFGVVWKANRVGHGMIALKVTRVSTAVDETTMKHMEEAIASGLNHPNVVEMYDVITLRKGNAWETWFMLEYCEMGSLARHLALVTSTTDEGTDLDLKLRRCLDIANGMVYLHSKNIIHGDLTAANVLLDRDGTAKITDFGISRMLTAASIRTQSYGTVSYMPPELLAKKELGLYTDVYSFGVIMWEIWHESRAWSSIMPATLLISKIRGEGHTLQWQETDGIVYNAYHDLAEKCLHFNCTDRPSFSKIVQTLHEILNTI